MAGTGSSGFPGLWKTSVASNRAIKDDERPGSVAIARAEILLVVTSPWYGDTFRRIRSTTVQVCCLSGFRLEVWSNSWAWRRLSASGRRHKKKEVAKAHSTSTRPESQQFRKSASSAMDISVWPS